MKDNLIQKQNIKNIDQNETIESTPIMNAQTFLNGGGGQIEGFNQTPLMTPIQAPMSMQKREEGLKSLRGMLGLGNLTEEQKIRMCMTTGVTQKRNPLLASPINIYNKKFVREKNEKVDLPQVLERNAKDIVKELNEDKKKEGEGGKEEYKANDVKSKLMNLAINSKGFN